MDGPGFDRWTRRRFGLAGGFAASTLALLGRLETEASKRKRKRRKNKKRCKRLGDTCRQGGKRKCCGDLRCDFHSGNSLSQTVCCKKAGKSCSDIFECCVGLTCGLADNTCIPITSDRALKANFGSVDRQDMLQRVRNLPISTWNYTSDDPAVRHIGPMAQDFVAAFGVGSDDRHIHPIDGQGVALAAIQGLAVELERLREENAALATRVAALETSSEPSVVS
ncbi:MAG: tail fiber domain-containing protein [Thermomicrobiales bacterium]